MNYHCINCVFDNMLREKMELLLCIVSLFLCMRSYVRFTPKIVLMEAYVRGPEMMKLKKNDVDKMRMLL